MRPYAGIGLVLFPASESGQTDMPSLPLYDEPGLGRFGVLSHWSLPGNELIFGPLPAPSPLIAAARKGEWLRIYYDDAGREAWIDARASGYFESWEQFLKRNQGHALAGLQPRYYRLLQQLDGALLATLTPAQSFKVLKLENDWLLVLTDQSLLGWLRWRDEDGRLLVGLKR